MDRHDVSKDVTAEIVADLHQKDLKIQHKFSCKGLTYWFDEQRKTAFCLVEAPSRAAIKQMHDQAHGEVPHRIIEVDHAVVESFLGRIEDPEKSRKTSLNIINDPAFRSLMIAGLQPSTLKQTLDKKVRFHIADHLNKISDRILQLQGRLVRQEQEQLLVSFDSVSNAVNCAMELRKEFIKDFPLPDSPVRLKVGLSAGVPVDEKQGLFETTIHTAATFYRLAAGTLVMSSEVRELYDSENAGSPLSPGSVVSLSPSEEKFLRDLWAYTEQEGSNSFLNIHALSRALGFSRSGLYRTMLQLTGQSPNSFLKEYRLRRALLLLQKRGMNISEVAFETGFSSPAYFSKCFHENFGILPSRYLRHSVS